MLTKDDIINQYQLNFDPADRRNNSLYLCTRDDKTGIDTLVDEMQAEGIWSAEPLHRVAEEQKAAYREQLEFVDAVSYKTDGADLVIARFNHPKFPSDDERWQRWRAFFDIRFSRR